MEEILLHIGEIILIIGLVVFGILGSILPVLPGVWVVYAGMLVQHFFRDGIEYHWAILVGFGLVTLVVQLLDYFIPIWGSKKLGAGKYGQWGSMIGVFVGAFLFPPFGIIVGPFLGAIIGELISGKSGEKALKAGTGAFLGFITGVFMKSFLAIVMGGWLIFKLFV
ncbi:MAG: DUF456 domain-containing protein [Saprospiraceae bacterium]|nr:DUF456 domain-containing protein [Saprospiraceae bacterium]